MCSQMKAFWDATGSLWMKGALLGKPVGMFVSTGTQGGGQETTPFTGVCQYTSKSTLCGGACVMFQHTKSHPKRGQPDCACVPQHCQILFIMG